MPLPILSVAEDNHQKGRDLPHKNVSNDTTRRHHANPKRLIRLDSTSTSNSILGSKTEVKADKGQISLESKKYRPKSALPTLSMNNCNNQLSQNSFNRNRKLENTSSIKSKHLHSDSTSSHTSLENIRLSTAFPSNVNRCDIITEALSCQIKELPNMSPSQTGDINISMSLKDYRSGQYASAIGRLDKATKHNTYFFPTFVRGLCHFHLKQFDLALNDFSLCYSFDDGKNKNSISEMKRKTNIFLKSLNHQGRGRCDVSNNRLSQSFAIFNRGIVKIKMNKVREALEDYTQAITLNDLDCDFYKNRALLYRRIGNFEAAQQDYESIRRIKQAHDVGISEKKALIHDLISDQGSMHCNTGQRKISLLSPVINVVISGKDQNNKKSSFLNNLQSVEFQRPSNLPRTKQFDSKNTSQNSNWNHHQGNNLSSPCGYSSNKKNSKSYHQRHPKFPKGGHSPTVTIRKRPRSDFHKMKSSVFGQLHTAVTTPANERTPAQLETLVDESKMMTAFSQLDRNELYTLWKYLEYQKYPSNVRIVEQGELAQDYYLVWTGRVSARVRKDKNTSKIWFSNHHPNQIVSINRHESSSSKLNIAKAFALEEEFTVNIMTAGETLGEAVMGERGKRRASCVTEEPTELLILRKKYFDRTFQKFLRTAYEEKLKKLSTFACFSHWDEKKMNSLASVCRERKYNAGETIVRQGSVATRIYFVKSGLISLVRRLYHSKKKFCDVCVAKLCAGDIFGEASVIFKNYPTTESNTYDRKISRQEYVRRIENNFVNDEGESIESTLFRGDCNQELDHRSLSCKDGSNNSMLMITQRYPSSVVCDTLAVCYHLDKVQMNVEDWDKETLCKLSTMAVSHPKDEVLHKAHLERIQFQRRSKVLVNQLVQRHPRDDYNYKSKENTKHN